eukprot:TRINITY_DN25906_c0_g1_i1.p1 TRINITY_DN25906_c0_g1~~TRINITY_DN25906_c0_g1_i1.p1  ORF type:complete len:531 (+),score=90.20 TRINITY_DN25906_c0_g1_i1:41-1633(+)
MPSDGAKAAAQLFARRQREQQTSGETLSLQVDDKPRLKGGKAGPAGGKNGHSGKQAHGMISPTPKQPSHPPPPQVLRQTQQRVPRIHVPQRQLGANPPSHPLVQKQQVQLLRQQHAPAKPKQPAAPPPQNLLRQAATATKRARQPIVPHQTLPGPFPLNTPLRIWYPSDHDHHIPELLDGLPGDALALSIEGKQKSLCSQADTVLASFFDGESHEEKDLQYSEGNTQNDDSWELFPGVGAALQGTAADTRDMFCIAASRSHCIWAVGVSDNGACRYRASRIALALSLCSINSAKGDKLDLSDVPSFAALFEKIQESSMPEAPAAKVARRQPKQPQHPPATVGQPSKSALNGSASSAPRPASATIPAVRKGAPVINKKPGPVIRWISLEGRSKPALLEDLPETALVLGGGDMLKDIYTNSDALLAHILGWTEDDVELHDDAASLSEVDAALRQVSQKQSPFCVASSSSRGIWAVGVGMRLDVRHSAAQVALAAMIYMLEYEDTDATLDLSEYPAFSELLDEVRSSMSNMFG